MTHRRQLHHYGTVQQLQVYEWMDMVASEHSSFVTKRQIGVTYEGRPMYALEFKKGITPGPKPIIFVDALIHCREWITTASLLFIFKEVSGSEILKFTVIATGVLQ